MSRRSGVLLPLSAMPGAYGCGTMGEESRRVLKELSELGFSAWQILPVHPPRTNHSPYSADSAFAGNPVYLDAQELAEDGYLRPEDAFSRRTEDEGYRVDYEEAEKRTRAMTRAAFAYCAERTRPLWEAYGHRESYWLDDYALFSALSDAFGTADWALWPEELRDRQDDAMRNARRKYRRETEQVIFNQWLWEEQWMKLREYAANLSMEIIGDMPMFVAKESADTWAHQRLFALDHGRTVKAAGAPPDSFSADGQFWGNPLYDWDAMADEDYQWFLERFHRAFALHDRIRLDHFRGLSAFWEIPAEAENASSGRWVKGPGMAFIEKVKAAFPDAGIIAEDLGQLDEDVHMLRRASGFPGMRVMQFGFADGAQEHLPHNIPVHCVAYSGTHDNNTTLGYLYEASPREREKFLRYSGLTQDWGQGGKQAPGVHAMLRLLWSCPAELVITTFQDLFGWGADTRMNRPGTAKGQWEVRLTQEALDGMDREFIVNLQRDFERSESV